MHELHELTEGIAANASLHEVHVAVVEDRTPATQVGWADGNSPVSHVRSQLVPWSIVVETPAQVVPNMPLIGCVTAPTSQVCSVHGVVASASASTRPAAHGAHDVAPLRLRVFVTLPVGHARHAVSESSSWS